MIAIVLLLVAVAGSGWAEEVYSRLTLSSGGVLTGWYDAETGMLRTPQGSMRVPVDRVARREQIEPPAEPQRSPAPVGPGHEGNRSPAATPDRAVGEDHRAAAEDALRRALLTAIEIAATAGKAPGQAQVLLDSDTVAIRSAKELANQDVARKEHLGQMAKETRALLKGPHLNNLSGRVSDIFGNVEASGYADVSKHADAIVADAARVCALLTSRMEALLPYDDQTDTVRERDRKVLHNTRQQLLQQLADRMTQVSAMPREADSGQTAPHTQRVRGAVDVILAVWSYSPPSGVVK